MKPLPVLFSAASLALLSCDDSSKSDTRAPESGQTSLAAILLEEAPGGAVGITEARKDPTPGREIVLSGKVMGKMSPFVDGYALVTLGDPTRITSCDLRTGDDCPTPWDVCCDDQDVITASIATVQVVGEDGRPLRQSLKGIGGMKELSSLVVKGTIAKGSNPNNLLVNATGIHIAMVEPTTDNPAPK